MKKLLLTLLLLTGLSGDVFAQRVNTTEIRGRGRASTPTCPSNYGVIWFDSVTKTFRKCEDGGVASAFGGSGLTIGTTAITSGTSTRLLFNLGGVVSDDADLTFATDTLTATKVAVTTLLTATSPRITTGILDANGNSMLAFTPTASAVNFFTMTNRATGGGSTNGAILSSTGSDASVDMDFDTKGTASRYQWKINGAVKMDYTDVGGGVFALRNMSGQIRANGGILDNDFVSWNNDSSVGRVSAGIVGVGTGGAGSFAGGLKLSSITFTNLADSITAPTLSGFGTSPSVTANNGTIAFTINIGTGGTASTGTITLPAAATGWVCSLYNITNPDSSVTHQTGGTTTTVVVKNYSRTTGVAATWAASDVLACSCRAY